VVEQLEPDRLRPPEGRVLELGLTRCRAAQGRHRPQPHLAFAFTGNKFEFRAVGSSPHLLAADRSQTPSSPSPSRRWPMSSRSSSPTTWRVSQDPGHHHQREQAGPVRGQQLLEEWHAEAARRGLPQRHETSDAFRPRDREARSCLEVRLLSERELARASRSTGSATSRSRHRGQLRSDMAKT